MKINVYEVSSPFRKAKNVIAAPNVSVAERVYRNLQEMSGLLVNTSVKGDIEIQENELERLIVRDNRKRVIVGEVIFPTREELSEGFLKEYEKYRSVLF